MDQSKINTISSPQSGFVNNKDNLDLPFMTDLSLNDLASPKTGEKRPAPTETEAAYIADQGEKLKRAWYNALTTSRLKDSSEKDSIQAVIAHNEKVISSLEDVKVELVYLQFRFLCVIRRSKKGGSKENVQFEKDRLENVQANIFKLDQEIRRREKRVQHLQLAMADLEDDLKTSDLMSLFSNC